MNTNTRRTEVTNVLVCRVAERQWEAVDRQLKSDNLDNK